MKLANLFIVFGAMLFLLPACSKDRSQEEKIRITIEKPEAQKPQETAPKAEVPGEKPQAESQKKVARPQTAKPEPVPEREPVRPERRTERAASPPAPNRSLAFKYVAEHLDLTKYSKQEIKDYWLSIRGKRVSWAGTVYQARTSRRGFKILVENRNALTRSGYNIVLVKKGPTNIGDIPRGADIRFSGVLFDIQPSKGSGPLIVLVDARVQN